MILLICLLPVDASGQSQTVANDYENLLESWQRSDPETASQQIDAAIEKNGGTPLIFDLNLLFLVQHKGTTVPRIVSDANEWAASDGR